MHATELNFRSFAENARDGIFVNREQHLVYTNRSLEEMLGYVPGDLRGVDLDVILATDPEEQETTGCSDIDRPHNGPFETLFRRKNGSWCPVEVTVVEATWRGQPATIFVVRDITMRERREAELRETESKFQQLTQNIDEVFFVRDLRNNKLIYISPAYEKIWRQPISAMYENALAFMEYIHPEDKERIQEIIQQRNQFLEGFSTYQYRIVWPNDEVRWIRTRTFPVLDESGQPHRVAGIAEDITEYKNAETALRLSEEHLRRSLQYANIGTWDWDIRTGALSWSGSVAPLFGYKDGEIDATYEAFLTAIHPDDRQMVEGAVRACVDSGRDYDVEHRVSWPDGSVHWLHESGGVVYGADGKAERMLGVVRDITQRKLTEHSLIESENKYRAVMENASDAILLGTMDAWIIDANRRAAELFGYTHDELLQLHASTLHPKSEHPTLAAAFDDLRTKGNSLYEHQILCKDGSIINAEVAATVIDYQGTKVAMAIFHDITARKRAEEERLAVAKVQRDTLVREVHHRIKNNLQGVVGLLRQQATKSPELRGPLESAINQVNSVAVVHGLHSKSSSENIILCEMVRAICHSTGGLMGKVIEPFVTVSVENPIRIANAEAVPLALILNELVFNAVKHQAVEMEPVQVFLEDVRDGASVRIITPGSHVPDNFDFAGGSGLGTGLKLVKSLLPPSGCQLQIKGESRGVITELLLSPPVLMSSQRIK